MLRLHLLLPLLLLGWFQDVQANKHRVKRSSPEFFFELWTNPIPYSFDSRYTEAEKTAVRDALKTFEENSCLEFKEDSTPESRIEYTYTEANKQCSGEISLSRDVVAHVYLKTACMHTTGIQHETMHALGFRHTQTRNDRDKYVYIAPEMLDDSRYSKLELPPGSTYYGIPYEYNSILHYGVSKNLQLLDHEWITTVFGNNMVFNDWKFLNLRYKCNETCPSDVPITCYNGGYQNSRDCSQCICPRFHDGPQCQEERNVVDLTPGKAETLYDGWERTDKNPKMILDETFFHKSPARIIKAPKGSRIIINIVNITEPNVGYDSSNKTCNLYGFEIAEEDLTRVGKRYCSWKRIGDTIISKSNTIGFLIFSSPSFAFSANVTFTVEHTTSAYNQHQTKDPRDEAPQSAPSTPQAALQSPGPVTVVAAEKEEAPLTSPPIGADHN